MLRPQVPTPPRSQAKAPDLPEEYVLGVWWLNPGPEKATKPFPRRVQRAPFLNYVRPRGSILFFRESPLPFSPDRPSQV